MKFELPENFLLIYVERIIPQREPPKHVHYHGKSFQKATGSGIGEQHACTFRQRTAVTITLPSTYTLNNTGGWLGDWLGGREDRPSVPLGCGSLTRFCLLESEQEEVNLEGEGVASSSTSLLYCQRAPIRSPPSQNSPLI